MLKKTKHFLRANKIPYTKEHVNPLMVPERVYVLNFGQDDEGHYLNRFIVEHTYTWTGRIKINQITLRLHGQVHPHVFKNEHELLHYLKKHTDQLTKALDQDK